MKVKLCVIIFLVAGLLHAQNTVSNDLLRNGLDSIRAGNFDRASEIFRRCLEDDSLEAFHADCLFWLMKSDIARGAYSDASAEAYRYTVMYPAHGRLEEVEYESARLVYLEGDAEQAVVALGAFIGRYADSDFVPSALYWVGESLMSLGRLEEADAVFSDILSKYPSSVKREAARYRRSEISLLYRERELLDLLKWSHEEYLQDAEEFYRREAEYRAALTSANPSAIQGQEVGTASLLAAKQRLLILKQFYIEELLRLSDEL